MKYFIPYLNCATLLLVAGFIFAQNDADELLALVEEKLEEQMPFAASFDYRITYPDGSIEDEEGIVYINKHKLRFEFGSLLIISDGEDQWLYQSEINEVQITHAPEDEFDLLGLSTFITDTDLADFTYDITGGETIETHAMEIIEFKPVDRNNPIVKMRIRVFQNTRLPYSMETFERNGISHSILIKEIEAIQSDTAEIFVFRPDAYPDIYVEDLRID